MEEPREKAAVVTALASGLPPDALCSARVKAGVVFPTKKEVVTLWSV